MRLCVVTAPRGASPFLDDAILSINNQSCDVEHVIVCPAGRVPLIATGTHATVLPDMGAGLYAALNQGSRAPGNWDALTSLNDGDLLLSPGFDCACRELARMLNDEGFRNGCRKAARERILDSFGNQKSAATHRDLYEELIRRT